MKRKKRNCLALLFCAVAMSLVSLSACDGNDDKRSLTPKEKKAAFESVKGNYKGYIVYTANNSGKNARKNDTLAISWSLQADTLLTLHALPSRVLAQFVTDKALRDTLSAQPDVELACPIEFTGIEPVSFRINPKTLTYNNVKQKDGSVQVNMGFYKRHSASYGRYNSQKKQLSLQIVQSEVAVKGKSNALLKGVVPLRFYGTRQ